MNDKDIKSCVKTLESLRRLALNIHGVIDAVDDENINKMIDMLQNSPTLMSGTSDNYSELPNSSGDCVSRQAVIDRINWWFGILKQNPDILIDDIKTIPSAQLTLYGYNIELLELIARVLQKENLPPERIVEALTDIGRIVAIVKDEFEEALRKAVEQCTI